MKNHIILLKLKGIFCLIIPSVLTFTINAQTFNPVVTAVPTLTISPDARGAGIGSVGAATSPDVYSQYWNPAKYIFTENEKAVSLSYSSWLSSLMKNYKLAYLSGYYHFNDLNSISMSVGYLSKGKITFSQDNDYIDMSVNLYEFYIDGALAHKFTDNFSASLAFRYINSNLYNELNYTGETEIYAGNAVTVNLGTFYTKNLETGKLSLGMNISDIGTKITFDNYATTKFLPANLRLGGSYSFSIDEDKLLSINADINKLLVPSQNGNEDYENTSALQGVILSFNDAPGGISEELREITFSTGVEYSSNNQLFLRAGYFHESPTKGYRSHYSIGGGYALGNLHLDMAYLISTQSAVNFVDRMLIMSLSYNISPTH